MKILLTGFEPWGSNAVNPSGEVARELGGEVLPVDFEKADRLLRGLLRRRRPDALVMLGLAESRSVINLEAVALNIDFHGLRWRMIERRAPLALRGRLPLAAIQQRLKTSRIRSVISHHAGTFLCNHVFYRGLRWTDGPCGFVHVPPFKALPRARMLRAVRAILAAVGGSSRAATP